jgi:hypothetical protein
VIFAKLSPALTATFNWENPARGRSKRKKNSFFIKIIFEKVRLLSARVRGIRVHFLIKACNFLPGNSPGYFLEKGGYIVAL